MAHIDGIDMRTLTSDEIGELLAAAEAEQLKRGRRQWAQKKQRDAERHMDVRCPACGAQERTRCLDGGKRIEVSHVERGWKTHPCPVCAAAAGDPCKVGQIFVTSVHAARVSLTNR